MSRGLKTPLYEQHIAASARIVEFGDWLLPISYESQVKEHHAVRSDVGMFDVSHMTVTDITGADTLAFLSKLLANDINKVSTISGKALYSCMLNETGGVIDDLIVYYLNDNDCRLVTNAATNAKDMAWLEKQAASFTDLKITEKPELALIAIQGPNAIRQLQKVFADSPIAKMTGELKRFQGGFASDDIFIGRTGYTGEDGVEMITTASEAASIWEALIKSGTTPCGLGARDTLRLEAGMALYGSDLGEDYTPIESGLSWTVAMKDAREFIGRSALEAPAKHKMVGLVLEGKGVLRAHQSVVLNGEVIGETTSGSFSPSLNHSIALARIGSQYELSVDDKVNVSIRNKEVQVRIVKYPFYPQ